MPTDDASKSEIAVAAPHLTADELRTALVSVLGQTYGGSEAPPGARRAECSLHQIPRAFELASGDHLRLRPATTRLRKGCKVALIDVIRTMGASDRAQPAVADSDSKSLDVAANTPRSLGQLDHADPVHEEILQIQGDLDMSGWGFGK